MLTYLSGCRKVHLANSYDQENSGRMGETDSLEDWILVVKHVTARDSGSYECQVGLSQSISFLDLQINLCWVKRIWRNSFFTQVTTDSGNIKSHRVELKVETPEAFILADEEYHIDTGSSLSLVCIIEKATEPPQWVFN